MSFDIEISILKQIYLNIRNSAPSYLQQDQIDILNDIYIDLFYHDIHELGTKNLLLNLLKKFFQLKVYLFDSADSFSLIILYVNNSHEFDSKKLIKFIDRSTLRSDITDIFSRFSVAFKFGLLSCPSVFSQDIKNYKLDDFNFVNRNNSFFAKLDSIYAYKLQANYYSDLLSKFLNRLSLHAFALYICSIVAPSHFGISKDPKKMSTDRILDVFSYRNARPFANSFNLTTSCPVAEFYTISLLKITQIDEEKITSAMKEVSELGVLKYLLFLVLENADIDKEFSNGWNPLLCASKNGKIDCVEFMLSVAAAVDTYRHSLRTPLIWATDFSRYDCVQELIKYGANVNIQDSYGVCALHMASSRIEPSANLTVKFLLENGADPNSQSITGATSLCIAASDGNYSVMKELISFGADLEIKSEKGDSPLMITAKSGFTSCLELLIENNANMNSQNNIGITPLMYTIVHHKFECFKLLVKKGAKIDLSNSEGTTALMIATMKGRVDYLNILLEMHANIDLDNNRDKTTALMYAARYGQVECLNILLNYGANVNLKNQDKLTAIELAQSLGQKQCVQILKDHMSTK